MTTPTLPDDRVETMRMRVMHRVDQDVTRRGRRARTTIGLTAASVLVVGLGGYAISLTSHDDNVSASSSSDAGSASGGSAADAPAPGALLDQNGNSELAAGKLPAGASRQVVTTGTVSVTVEQPRVTAQKLSAWVESIGGRIDDRSETGAGRDMSASLTVRVPSDQVTTTVDRLGTYGTVDDVSIQNSDVTAQATDLDARIDALQISIGRLEAILGGAGSSTEVIKAENALTKRQEQLESLQAQRKALGDQVSLSTLTIELSQRDSVGSVEPGGFTGGLRDGWNGLVNTLNAVVEVAGVLLPWAVIAVVLLGVGRLVVRRRGSWN